MTRSELLVLLDGLGVTEPDDTLNFFSTSNNYEQIMDPAVTGVVARIKGQSAYSVYVTPGDFNE